MEVGNSLTRAQLILHMSNVKSMAEFVNLKRIIPPSTPTRMLIKRDYPGLGRFANLH